MQSRIFSSHYFRFQSHDPSEFIDLVHWFLSIINVENSCAASYVCGNHDTFSRILW